MRSLDGCSESWPGSSPSTSGPHSRDISYAKMWGQWMDEPKTEIQMWNFFRGSHNLNIQGNFHFILQYVYFKKKKNQLAVSCSFSFKLSSRILAPRCTVSFCLFVPLTKHECYTYGFVCPMKQPHIPLGKGSFAPLGKQLSSKSSTALRSQA